MGNVSIALPSFPAPRGWCMAYSWLHRDFADDHPEATVIGTDISPIQPKWVPPNLKL